MALYIVALLSARVHAQTTACPAGLGLWETRAPLPIQATEVASAALGSRIYVLGGILPSGDSSSRLFIYDALQDSWSEGAPLPIAGGINHANLAAGSFAVSGEGGPGELYMLGALLGDGSATGRSFAYSPGSNAWRELAPMPTPRGAAGIARGGDLIYVAGGANAIGSVNHFAAYDPRANSWATLPPMPTPRDHLTAQVLCSSASCAERQFVAFAGRRNGALVAATEAFNLTVASAWTTRAPILTPRAGIGSASTPDSAFVLGGEGSATADGTFPQNELYNAATNSWCSLAPLPLPRHGFYAATLRAQGVDATTSPTADPDPIFTIAGGPRAGAFFSDVNEVFFPPPGLPPRMDSGGVVNAASYRGEIAGGSIVSLFGHDMTYRQLSQPRLPLPAQWNGVQVLVNGVPAPLIYTSGRQINFVLPAGTASPARIRVSKGDVVSATEEIVNVLGTAPGIFSADGSGRGQGAILHAGSSRLADASRPARAGDALEIYLTGLLDCAPGQACILVAPDVAIGGQSAPLLFYGRAPGFAGLNQINVRVPAGVAPGLAVPVTVSHAGRSSNQVTIAVQ